MQRSDGRILTTHVGSLPRPPALRDLLVAPGPGRGGGRRRARARGRRRASRAWSPGSSTPASTSATTASSRARASPPTWPQRMKGFGGHEPAAARRRTSSTSPTTPRCWPGAGATRRASATRRRPSPRSSYADLGPAARECDAFLRATDARPRRFVERFMTAASPGIDRHHPAQRPLRLARAYVMALAGEMRKEYELIHARGFVLQIDCPDLAMERARFFRRRLARRLPPMVELHVEAINRAIAGIPPDRIRLHVCWGNYDGPHTHDVPLEAMLPLAATRRGSARSSLPMANPRHQHEYRVLKRIRLPDGDAAPARRHRHDHQLRRAPRGRRRPDLRARSTRSATATRVIASHRLRLRHLRGLGDGRPQRGVGQARRPPRRRRPREPASLVLTAGDQRRRASRCTRTTRGGSARRRRGHASSARRRAQLPRRRPRPRADRAPAPRGAAPPTGRRPPAGRGRTPAAAAGSPTPPPPAVREERLHPLGDRGESSPRCAG